MPRVQAEKNKKMIANVFDIIEAMVVAIVASILILTLLFRTGYVTGTSMVSTMHPNDRYIVSDLFYTPKPGDIVVFQPDMEKVNNSATNEKLFVKRVIAVGGQTVTIKNEKNENGEIIKSEVYVDGILQEESYLDPGQITKTKSSEAIRTIVVPEGQFFAMGDNRVNSYDCRDIGCQDTRRIVGKVIFRFFPFNQMGVIN
ncbi:MAG: signal peptidase I [Clostridiales bacterium]|nr:MAG: signal peptidase I [Clostridiales bacterium]